MGWTCSSVAETKKLILNFGGETSFKTVAFKTEKEMDLREMKCDIVRWKEAVQDGL
jgi:hypothetical protein